LSEHRRLLIVLVAAAAAHVVALLLTPYVVTRSVVGRPFAGSGVNALGHRELPKPGMKAWGPSPDLLYSKCVYDVSASPVRIETPIPPEDYWSMSVYAANSDLVGVINDRQLDERRVDVVLALPDQAVPEGVRVMRVPMAEGVALFRMLVPDHAKLPEKDAIRRRGRCTTLG
jgi:uncharacterized membrane protein